MKFSPVSVTWLWHHTPVPSEHSWAWCDAGPPQSQQPPGFGARCDVADSALAPGVLLAECRSVARTTAYEKEAPSPAWVWKTGKDQNDLLIIILEKWVGEFLNSLLNLSKLQWSRCPQQYLQTVRPSTQRGWSQVGPLTWSWSYNKIMLGL